jgi:hypothetical protein
MSRMFAGAVEFNQAIGAWTVSNVIDMQFMFTSASVFDQSIANWDTSV